MSDITIIGYSFKLSQDVNDDTSFWDVLQNKRNLASDWPEDRVKVDSFASNKHQKWNGKGGHFIKDDVAAFDAPFFSVTAKEAAAMDPMQRWTLETTYHAFENAGLPVESLKGSRTAVFSASMLEDYSRMTAMDPDNLERTAVTGSTVSCIIPNRVSWYFGLRGPSIHVNTACSSSLSAVDMACKVLNSGDASCAVVAGANLLLDPSIFQVLANQGFLSPDGVCHSFDERANGYGRGEGVIAMVLKPVQAAIENGDMIRAVIRSIGSNQDGHTPVLTQPSFQAQEELIRHVYEKADLDMSQTRFVEAHGTGTPVGDPIEVKAIGRCFREYRSQVEPLYIGSVKASVGHLEGANQVILEKGIIPPNALFENINPALNADAYNIEIPRRSIRWPTEGLRRVSINSFGFGGSNSHIVLDDALHYLQDRDLAGLHNTSKIPKPLTNSYTNGRHTNGTNGTAHEQKLSNTPKLLVWTAADEKAAKRTVEPYNEIYKEKILGHPERLGQLAFTLGSKRSLMLWRSFAVVDGSMNEDLSPSKPIRSSSDCGIAFVFTGQGAQYVNMGLGLEQYPVYNATLKKINEIYFSLGCSWDLFDELRCTDTTNEPEYSQPLSTAIQIALFELLLSFGIKPKVVVGHSSGEIAAAYASGGLSLEAACKVSYFRGLLAGKLKRANSSSAGAMISINLAVHEVSEFLAKADVTSVNVACINSSLNVTLSGPEGAIDIIKAQADRDGTFAQKLKTGVAYHSSSMKGIADEYLAALDGLTGSHVEDRTPMISTVTGKHVNTETMTSGQYWVDNMLSPVRFAQALQVIANKNFMSKAGLGNITDLVEIGPHPALRRPVRDTLRYPVSIPATNQQAAKETFLVDCPKYPFDRSQRYWAESRLSRDFRLRGGVKGDLLGVRVSDWNPLEPRWRNFWSIDSSPWVGDHQISDTTLFPASGMLVMAIEAAQEMAPPEDSVAGFLIEKAEFMNPIVVPETWEHRIETQVRLRPIEREEGERFDVSIFTYSRHEWTQCFCATILVDNSDDEERQLNHQHLPSQYQNATESCVSPFDSNIFYHDAAKVGLRYGESFQLMRDIRWDNKTSAIGNIDLARTKLDTMSLVHPAVLDQAFQVLRISSGQQPAANVPIRLKNMWFSSKRWHTNSVRWLSQSTLTVHGYGEQGSILALSENGDVLCHIEKAITSAVSGETAEIEKKLVYSIEWKPQLSMLSPDQLTRACDANAVSKDDSTVLANHSKLCYTLELVSSRTLKHIDKAKVPADLQRHVEWMEHHVSKLPPQQCQEADALTEEQIESRLTEVDSVLPAWKLYTTCARRLPEILAGELDPLQVVFESDQADIFYSNLFQNLCADGRLNHLLDLASHENPALRILEVGAGTGGMTGHVISALQEREKRTGGLAFSEYTYTDISPAFFETASQRWPDLQSRIIFKTLDLGKPIDTQGFEPGSYDVVIAASVLHATPYLEATIRNVHKALKPGGKMVLLEVINPDDIATNFMAGLVPGWWVAREEWRPHSAAIPEHSWDKCLRDNGFSGNDMVIRDYEDDQCHIMSVIVTTTMEAVSQEPSKGRLIFLVSDGSSSREKGLADSVRTQLDPSGGRQTQIVPFDQESLDMVKLTNQDCVISLMEVDGHPLLSTLSEQDFISLQLLVRKASNLLWVTSTSLDDPKCPDFSVAQGLFRSIRAEQPDTHIVNLSIQDDEPFESCTDLISQAYHRSFDTRTPSNEVEYVAHDGVITVGRAVEDIAAKNSLRSILSKQLYQKPWGDGPALELSISKPGSLESLCFIEDTTYTEELDPCEVEIEAQVWGLDSRDLAIAAGRVDFRGERFGRDCLGVVTHVGSYCGGSLRPGDRVGMVASGCLRKYPRADRGRVFKLPQSISFEEAASVVIPGLASYHAIFNIARLQPNEKVLIASTTKSTTLIAARLAKTLGAQVFAAVSSPGERQLLVDSLAIPAEHIVDSKSTLLSQTLMRITGQYGFDVVLSDNGLDPQVSFSCLVDSGRVVNIGNLDNSGNPMLPAKLLARNISFSSVDVTTLGPKIISEASKNNMQLLADIKIQLPRLSQFFEVSQIEDAFKYLQRDDSLGRVVVTINPDAKVPQFIQENRTWTFDENSTYLVTGGSGGIGRAIIQWMVSRGAKHLLVPSRSGATTESAAKLVSDLTSNGVQIVAPKCDVSNSQSVSDMIEECSETMPPIKGCINAAMVLQDAIFQTNMTFQQWDLTIRSKIQTSRNLHELLPNNLDFFILLSSLAGVVGQMASANYAAGCSYQDALARYRLAHGQKALSLDIGWMRNIGIISESEAYQRQRQTSNDMQPIGDKELLALLTLCCDPDSSLILPLLANGQVLFGLRTPADILKEGQQPPALLERPLLAAFSYLVDGKTTISHEIDHIQNARDVFQMAQDVGGKRVVVIRAIAAKLARAMSISPDDVEPSKPLSSYGVDSLMAVELRNWINKEFSAMVAVFDIIGGVSIAGVAEVVVARSSL
ncbi:polyketide synthase [Fusarium austroafricanum]|uniref:Polyketide synthase n=1 Tax=Fusarium austroafricanum TaxID=2364996 RepID=A0A8H4K4X3_9HYPO|nr:polyketide synthase [Fusarium austroafricanum]